MDEPKTQNKGFITYCIVPGCMEEAASVNPDDWCIKHWAEWLGWPQNDEGRPEWMKNTKEE